MARNPIFLVGTSSGKLRYFNHPPVKMFTFNRLAQRQDRSFLYHLDPRLVETVTFLSLSGAFDESHRFVLRLRGVEGFDYRIEWSDDLRDWKELTSWTDFDGEEVFRDPASGPAGGRYYRVQEF